MADKSVQMVERMDEGILHQFLGVLLLRNQAHYEAEHLVAVALQEIAVVLDMTVEDTGYQLLFVRQHQNKLSSVRLEDIFLFPVLGVFRLALSLV